MSDRSFELAGHLAGSYHALEFKYEKLLAFVKAVSASKIWGNDAKELLREIGESE